MHVAGVLWIDTGTNIRPTEIRKKNGESLGIGMKCDGWELSFFLPKHSNKCEQNNLWSNCIRPSLRFRIQLHRSTYCAVNVESDINLYEPYKINSITIEPIRMHLLVLFRVGGITLAERKKRSRLTQSIKIARAKMNEAHKKKPPHGTNQIEKYIYTKTRCFGEYGEFVACTTVNSEHTQVTSRLFNHTALYEDVRRDWKIDAIIWFSNRIKNQHHSEEVPFFFFFFNAKIKNANFIISAHSKSFHWKWFQVSGQWPK